jgi:4-amino-4-deoxy-L-arabinose transferase-like glycosyltransferase
VIDWTLFLVMIGSALTSALTIVLLFSLALRLGDGEAPWRAVVSRALYALCGLAVVAGVLVIVTHRFWG